jgi:hypothetical protein
LFLKNKSTDETNTPSGFSTAETKNDCAIGSSPSLFVGGQHDTHLEHEPYGQLPSLPGSFQYVYFGLQEGVLVLVGGTEGVLDLEGGGVVGGGFGVLVVGFAGVLVVTCFDLEGVCVIGVVTGTVGSGVCDFVIERVGVFVIGVFDGVAVRVRVVLGVGGGNRTVISSSLLRSII